MLLGVPSGTLASLLSRGRELLRDQLSRQGVAVGALALGPLLAAEAHALELPSGFAAAAAKAAGAVAGGGSALAAGASPKAAALSQACLKAMAAAKLTLVAGAATLLLAVGGVSAALTRDHGAVDAPPPAALVQPAAAAVPASAAPVAADDDPVAALQARVRALRANDLVALLRLEPLGTQQLAEQAWRSGVTPAPGLPAMVDPLLGMALSEPGRQQLLPLIASLLANVPSEQWSHDLSAFRLPSTGPAAARAPPPDIASAQRQAAEELLGRFAAWLAQARVGEGDEAGRRSISSRRSARCASPAPPSSAGSSCPRRCCAWARAQRAQRGAGVYGLEIDAMLDSVRISAPPRPAPIPAPAARGGLYRLRRRPPHPAADGAPRRALAAAGRRWPAGAWRAGQDQSF